MAWHGPLKLSRPQISRSWRQRKLHHVHWHAHLCPFHRHFDQTRWHHDILTDISEDSTTCYPPKPPPTFKHDNLDELLLQRWWRPLTSLSSPRAGHSRPGPHSCRCQSRCSWERCRRSRSCSAPRRCIGEQLDHVSPPLEGGFQAFLLLPHLGADVLPAADRSPAKCLVKFKSGNDASSMMHKIGRWYFYFQRWTNKTTKQVVLSIQARALLELRLIVVQLFVESNQSENDETSNPIS